MRQWEAQINRLIKEAAVRRASDRGMSRIAHSNTTNLAQPTRQASTSYSHHNSTSHSAYFVPNHSNGPNRRPNQYGSDEQVPNATPNGLYGSGPQGYPPHNGFEEDADDDEFEDYPPASNYGSSGRGTPVGSRRGNAMSMPPERDAIPGYDRPRARTADTNGLLMAQWRTNGLPPPPAPSSSSASRPVTPRLNSNMSTASYASDTSFGNGVKPRQPLRSQFSSTKLKSVYDSGDLRNNKAPTPPVNVSPLPPMSRSRSASQPSAYVPKTIPPPLPTATQWNQRSNTSMGNNKRGSGSSQSTGDSSEYSPNSSSPITPFGSSESSLGGVGIGVSRSHTFENVTNGNSHHHFPPPVKVKVHFHEDIFVIQVSRTTEYDELVEKVGRKIRLCGPRRDDGPLRVKYKDEDGDMVSLGSTEDVQMAFEQYRPGGQVTLFVT
jgi:cell division control protein 24